MILPLEMPKQFGKLWVSLTLNLKKKKTFRKNIPGKPSRVIEANNNDI